MIYKYYINCFKNGEPTYAAGYIEAENEQKAIDKIIEPYDKNAYEFLELKEASRGQHRYVSGLIEGEEEVELNDTD